MQSLKTSYNLPRGLKLRTTIFALTSALILSTFLALFATPAQSQSYSILYNFTGVQDGGGGESLISDGNGNLYGTTAGGGSLNFGTVYQFSRGSLSVLYSFADGGFGYWAYPWHHVTIGPDGSLYGTAKYGGLGYGTIFNVRQQRAFAGTASSAWAGTILYRFTGGYDGANPTGAPVFDASGNLYATSLFGGTGQGCNPGPACGVVFKLASEGGSWTESVIENFGYGQNSGTYPMDGVIFDASGNLYGTTAAGGQNDGGTVFKMTPSGSAWEWSLIYQFPLYDLVEPSGNTVMDGAGNLYAATGFSFGSTVLDTTFRNVGGGAVFALSPGGNGWTFDLLHNFAGNYSGYINDPIYLAVDHAGDIYGVAFYAGAYGKGSIFKLTPGTGGWTFTSLHDFCSDRSSCSDGAYPGGLTLDEAGNLYGTTYSGGSHDAGVLWTVGP